MEDDKIVKYMRLHSQIIIISISAIAFIIGAVFFILTIINKEEMTSSTDDKPINSSITCTKENNDDENDMTIYINYDNEDNIVNVTYEEKLNPPKKYTISNLKEEEHIDLFNSINGVSANIQIFNNHLIKTIKYDYQTIDLEQIKKELKKYLPKDAILLKTSELPITFSQFKDQELKDYTCELK